MQGGSRGMLTVYFINIRSGARYFSTPTDCAACKWTDLDSDNGNITCIKQVPSDVKVELNCCCWQLLSRASAASCHAPHLIRTALTLELAKLQKGIGNSRAACNSSQWRSMVPRYGKDQSVAAIAAPEWTGCSPGWFALILISLISQWPRLLRGPAAFPLISRQGEKNGALNPSGREYSSLVCSQISQNLEESGGCELGQRGFGWGRFLAMSKKIWFKKFTRRSGEKLSCLTFWSETMEPFRVRK